VEVEAAETPTEPVAEAEPVLEAEPVAEPGAVEAEPEAVAPDEVSLEAILEDLKRREGHTE